MYHYCGVSFLARKLRKMWAAQGSKHEMRRRTPLWIPSPSHLKLSNLRLSRSHAHAEIWLLIPNLWDEPSSDSDHGDLVIINTAVRLFYIPLATLWCFIHRSRMSIFVGDMNILPFRVRISEARPLRDAVCCWRSCYAPLQLRQNLE
jgi:hypothetical protein